MGTEPPMGPFTGSGLKFRVTVDTDLDATLVQSSTVLRPPVGDDAVSTSSNGFVLPARSLGSGFATLHFYCTAPDSTPLQSTVFCTATLDVWQLA